MPLEDLRMFMILLLSLCGAFVLVFSFVPPDTPADREDVMGRYKLANERQCNRLCWYRPLCSSYSFRRSSLDANSPNCILHTNSAGITTTINGDWTEKAASNSHIDNNCQSRNCGDKEVCVPVQTQSVGQLSPTFPASPVCMSLPEYCGQPQVLQNGHIVTRTFGQGDAAQVVCDKGFVMTPRQENSTDIHCMVTSRWPKVNCVQYEFHPNNDSFTELLPWPVANGQKLCVRGYIYKSGHFEINFVPTADNEENKNLHIALRYFVDAQYRNKVIWDERKNGSWLGEQRLGEMPLVVDDSFNITLNVQPDQVVMTLNEQHVYNISRHQVGTGVQVNRNVDLSQSTVLCCTGSAIMTYVNLIEGC